MRTDAWLEGTARAWGTIEMAEQVAVKRAPSRAGRSGLHRVECRDTALSGTCGGRSGEVDVRDTDIGDLLPSIHVPNPGRMALRIEPAAGRSDTSPTASRSDRQELPGDDHALSERMAHRAPRIEDFIERPGIRSPNPTGCGHDHVHRSWSARPRTAAALVTGRGAAARPPSRLIRRRCVHRGREIDTAGDGFFAAFEARLAPSAARWRSARRSAELGLELRIGLHAGECERAGGGLRGVAVHIGARVGAAAEAGEILVTGTVRDLVAGSGISFEDAGTRELKGLPESRQLFRVVGD